MSITDVYSILEQDRNWRSDELRFLKNLLSVITTEDERRRYRKALVAMLYAHFEGFFRTSLLVYADAINRQNLSSSAVNSRVAASSLDKAFHQYFSQKKAEIFKKRLPDDLALHRYARLVCLMEDLTSHLNATVEIPDSVVNTESNLKPDIVRKILFKLGLKHDLFAEYEGRIHLLLNYRNLIVHGDRFDGISSEEFKRLEQAVNDIMDGLIRHIIESLNQKAYLKQDTDEAMHDPTGVA